jgi:biopolymer transport protein ExbD
MAPLIDLVFLLLIFFLVAVKWRPQEEFIPLKLAAAEAQVPGIARPEPLQIYVSSIGDGCLIRIGWGRTVQINSRTMEQDLSRFIEEIEQVLTEQKRLTSDPIEIICEPDVKSEFWVRICNVFYGMKMTDITFPMAQRQGQDE